MIYIGFETANILVVYPCSHLLGWVITDQIVSLGVLLRLQQCVLMLEGLTFLLKCVIHSNYYHLNAFRPMLVTWRRTTKLFKYLIFDVYDSFRQIGLALQRIIHNTMKEIYY